MNKKYLKPSIEKILLIILVVQALLLLNLDDFSLKSLPIILINLILLLFNIRFLYNHSRRLEL